jgi:hypothetical protein
MMLKVPIRRIGGIHMQLNAGLEHLDGLLPVKIVIANESANTPFEM